MYIPQHFEPPSIEAMHTLMTTRPLATLVTLSGGNLDANHIPLHLVPDAAPYGVLRGHVAKANPIYGGPDNEIAALAIFHGPESYISPSWYPSKQDHGKVVPTWNYVVAHARGKLRFIDDPIWIRAQLDMLTGQQEAAQPSPWKIEDAPDEFIERMIGAVVGIELVIDTLQGKWKISQNQPLQNQKGVIAGLEKSSDTDALEMAACMNVFSTKP